jgi:DNA-binding NarL/FixJ family response regulator
MGTVGCLLKDGCPISAGSSTRCVVWPTAVSYSIPRLSLGCTSAAPLGHERIRREREVLAVIAEGRSNRPIATELVLTERAVEKYLTSTFD